MTDARSSSGSSPRRGRVRGVALAFNAAWCVACSDDASEGRWVGTAVDSAGVEVVSSPANGLWSEGQGWTVSEDLRIGSVAGGADYEFGQVGSIVVGSAGQMYVSDRQLQQVRVFSADGVYLRSLGRAGSGPGELGRGALDLVVTAGDTLLVPDLQNRRVNRFAPDGTALPSAPLDMARERPLRFHWNRASGVGAGQLRPAPSEGGSAPGSVDVIRVLETSGSFGDALLEVPSGGLFTGGGIRYFTPEPVWALTDSITVVYGVNSSYRISFFARDGALRRVVQKAHEPRPITDRDIRALFAYLDRAWLDAGVPPSRLQANHDRVSFEDFFPAFASFHPGREGTLWVQPVRSPGDLSDEEIERYNFIEDFGASDWDVFGPAGRYLGVVTMPRGFQPRLFHEDEIYGVQRDALDVQFIVRLRVSER